MVESWSIFGRTGMDGCWSTAVAPSLRPHSSTVCQGRSDHGQRQECAPEWCHERWKEGRKEGWKEGWPDGRQERWQEGHQADAACNATQEGAPFAVLCQPHLLKLFVCQRESFSDWYKEVITLSEMIDYYTVGGCYILRPWSFSIWESITAFMDGCAVPTALVHLVTH